MDERDKIAKKFGVPYPAGQIVFREGDDADTLYIIKKGEVEISLRTPKSKIVLATLGPGDFFGEMSLFMKSRRTASAMTLSPAYLLAISESALMSFLLHNGEFTRNFIEKLVKRLYRANATIEQLMLIGTETRVIKALYHCWKENGSREKSEGKAVVLLRSFLECGKKSTGLPEAEIRKILQKLKDQGLIFARPDTEGRSYIGFHETILNFFDLTM